MTLPASLNTHILFIDDEPKAGDLFQRHAEAAGLQVSSFQDPQRALDHFKSHGASVVVTDLRMPGLDGLQVIEQIHARDPQTPVIVITGYASVDTAIEALRLGAADFVKKPYDPDELMVVIERVGAQRQLQSENHLLRRQLDDAWQRYGMVGDSPAMQKLHSTVDKLANVRCHVIIEGESGTGKELTARAIHRLGDPELPFIVIDCGSLSDGLLESELFGHERGAFTGADRNKAGLLELASGGSVFLDEIANISEAMQIKLLRVIQEQQLLHVGGVKAIDIDIRIIAASNQPLEEAVASGAFRHDLYHRLNVVKIDLPTLRQRPNDIPALVQHFVSELSQRYQKPCDGFDADSMRQILSHDWPGNVRELRNLVERHIALADGPTLTLDQPLQTTKQNAPPTSTNNTSLSLAELERQHIIATLDQHKGNRKLAAQSLDINPSTLWRKLQAYGLGDTAE